MRVSVSLYLCVCVRVCACVSAAHLSSSPPPGLCSICSLAPSPAPSRKLCAYSPLRASSGVTPRTRLCEAGTPPALLHSPPSLISSAARWLLFFIFYFVPLWSWSRCLSISPVSSPVNAVEPSVRDSPGVCAAESGTFPCSSRSDLCRLSLFLFSPFFPVR